LRHLAPAIATVFALAGFGSPALAQDLEPSTCADALTAPLANARMAGFIEPEDAQLRTDVDFFHLSGEPGQRLTVIQSVDFERQPQPVVIGVFDEQCNRIASTADAGNNDVDFAVPANGTYLIGVADALDRNFAGDGGTFAGDYAYYVLPRLPQIDSFSGRLVDGFTGEPVAGRVSLQSCGGGFCRMLSRQSTAANGEFRFEIGLDRRTLPAGLLVATFAAEGYDSFTRTLLVEDREAPDLGDVFIQKPQHLE
jgi:hypothetical protein